VIVGATAVDDRVSSLTSLGGRPVFGHQKVRFTRRQIQGVAYVAVMQVDAIKGFSELFR
jgi:hypothetical protein